MKVDIYKKFIIILPYFMILSIIIGVFIGYFVLKNFEYVSSGLMYASIILFSIFLFKKMDIQDLNELKLFKFKKVQLNLIFWILYIINIISLLTFSIREPFFHLILLFLYVVIFLLIFNKDKSVNSILIKISLIMISQIYYTTLLSSYYFGWTDILSHVNIIKLVLNLGNVVPPSFDSNYSFFPLYHILFSINSTLLNFDVPSSIFLIAAPIFTISLFFLFKIYLGIIDNVELALFGIFVYSAEINVVFFGKYFVTRVLAFICFIILFYFMMRIAQETSLRNKIHFFSLFFLISVFLILVHQISILIIIFLLSTLLLCEILAQTRYKTVKFSYILILTTIFLAYWFYEALIFTEDLFNLRFKTILSEQPILLEDISQSSNIFLKMINNINPLIALFFIFLAILSIIWIKRNSFVLAVGIFSFITLALYIPSPLHIFWQSMMLLHFERFLLFLSPFMMFLMGYGVIMLLQFSNKKGKNFKFFSISVIILIMVIFIISGMGLLNFKEYSERDSFNEAELISFNYVFEKIPYGSNIYSDYYIASYFYLKKNSQSRIDGFPFYITKPIHKIQELKEIEGTIIFPQKQFLSSGLIFSKGSELDPEGGTYSFYPTNLNTEEYFKIKYRKNNIYSNNFILLFQ